MFNQSATSNDLFAQYFQPAPPTFDTQVRGENNAPTDDQLSLGNTAYKKGAYAKALTHWNRHATNNPPTDELNLFRGVATLASGGTNAVDYLEKVNDDDYKDIVEWYLALAYLKNNQPQPAKKLLTAIASQPSHFKKQTAAEMLEKWNN